MRAPIGRAEVAIEKQKLESVLFYKLMRFYKKDKETAEQPRLKVPVATAILIRQMNFLSLTIKGQDILLAMISLNNLVIQLIMHKMYQQQKKILSRHPSQDVQLLNSRKRLYCQESQDQSENIAYDNSDQAILQFRREIDKRFKISVINKLYTFPRIFQKVSDLISSDQQQTLQYDQKTEPLKPLLTQFQPEDVQNNQIFQPQAPFKKKNKIHTQRSQSSHKKKPKSKNQSIKKNTAKLTKNNNISGFKLRTETQFTNLSQPSKKKPKHAYQNSNISNVSFEKKPKFKHKKNAQSDIQYNKMQRLKTEPDSSSSFLDTVRNKFSKKNNNNFF